MPTTSPPTYDPAALVAAAGAPLRNVARQLNIDPAVLCRPLTLRQADGFAIQLGLHPASIWGADWWRPGKRRASTPAANVANACNE